MAAGFKILVVSDPHYAGPGERTRHDFEYRGILHPVLRRVARAYRHYIWLRDPLAHHVMLDRFLADAPSLDLTVANGDYSCDSAFVGVMDPFARESAALCLARLRERFSPAFRATIGDHELGKLSLFGGLGGLRFDSWRASVGELRLQPFWRQDVGRHVLLGVASSLVAWPMFRVESVPEEFHHWQREREIHMAAIREVFAGLAPQQRVILFCHDPSALPFLWREEAIRQKLHQVEMTVIGHLHTQLVFRASSWLAGMPTIGFLGNTVRRLSTALREARCWKHFKVTLCPSLTGIQLLKDGGYLTLELPADGQSAIRVRSHPLPWPAAP
jgi:hypothetical protein